VRHGVLTSLGSRESTIQFAQRLCAAWLLRQFRQFGHWQVGKPLADGRVVLAPVVPEERGRTEHDAPGARRPFESLPPQLRDPDPVASALAAGDISLVLSGHVHFTPVAETVGVRELVVPPLCSYADRTTIRFVTVADRTALEEAYTSALEDSATARGRTSLAAVRIIGAPLVDERDD
jgi:hypothetical protein